MLDGLLYTGGHANKCSLEARVTRMELNLIEFNFICVHRPLFGELCVRVCGVCSRVCLCVCASACGCACAYSQVRAGVPVRMCLFACVRACTCTRARLCMWVFACVRVYAR